MCTHHSCRDGKSTRLRILNRHSTTVQAHVHLLTIARKMFPRLCGNNIRVMGCEKTGSTKTLGNKAKVTGAYSKALGMETALLEFIQMSSAMRTFKAYTIWFVLILRKNEGKENPTLMRTEKEKKCDAGRSHEHIFKPPLKRFLRYTASWSEWCGFSHF